ncbi:peptide/nickel transport system permease protein [Lentibacillus persicus]|uniref:Peptide/nickel transport system permease protein n=1 Tax=Lentibacillus persicus TaxID=640948 RepID=A0A1I1W0H5_9BACI|nr:ABC transporter permease [Lentibacillus persicus]SFD87868.1 peptide/nickel transport system permease protein [Lentibacillus persicus]
MDTVRQNVNLTETKNNLKKQQRRLLMRKFLSNKPAVTGLSIMLFLIILSTVGAWLVQYSPLEMDPTSRLEGPSAEHVLGTDNFGRDLLSRVIYGSQVSLIVGFSVALITSVCGMIIGLYASYYKRLDNILMRICDGLMSFPAILLAIAIMAALGPSINNVILALSIVYTPHIARVVRSSGIVVRKQTYIEAIESQGASSTRVIWKRMAPNTLSPLIVQSTFIFANAIIIEAALSFLGAGVPAPQPSWGNILYDGKLVIFNAWWMTVFPGICIILSTLGLNLAGDGLRDIIDPNS